ncbi:MAG: ribosome silencing factor [Lachnospiraceae bacterium]|nr:ribosome silencing factor [Lachnospiraceae bacterium]
MEVKDAVKAAVEAIRDKKGEDIKVFYIADVSPLADYFILATGNNRNQIQAMSDEIDAALAKLNVHSKQIEGYDSANWILCDYGDFMVHIFNPESREFYNLERLWKDAKQEEF